MNYPELIKNHLTRSAEVKQKMIGACMPAIISIVNALTNAFKKGNKLLICGNGGSAADAQHIAAEFVVRLSHNLMRPALPAVSLSTDTSILTAGGNDIGFENVFARQVQALGTGGDLLIAISTSGNSGNILRAVETARKKGMTVIGFLAENGGQAEPLCDYALKIPSSNTQHIQEGHITAGHIICDLVEQTLFG